MGRRMKYEMARNTMLTMSRHDNGLPLDVGRLLLLQRLPDPFRRQRENQPAHDFVVHADIFVEDRYFLPGVPQAGTGLRNEVALGAQVP